MTSTAIFSAQCLRRVAAWTLLCTMLPANAVQASSEAATEHVRARLVAEFDGVQPGRTITLGVQQRIIPNWHTYWKNSGDSGLPTAIKWELPGGASAGEIQWPTPNRYKVGPITNYGYEDEVTLLTDVTVPANAPIGSTFPIKATVDWLVCEEECIPQQVKLALDVPVVASLDSKSHAVIANARARLPVSSPWPVSMHYLDGHVEVRIANAGAHADAIQDIWFYAAQWGQTVHSATQPHRVDGDAIVLTLQAGESPASAVAPLHGVLSITERSGDAALTRGFTVDAPATVPPVTDNSGGLSLPLAVLFAFLGGVILNLMPCVFPVLSIKALSLLDHAQQSPLQARLHGGVYTAGVVASFIALACVLLALRAGGTQIGWGFQFQSPLFVLIVTYLIFAVGLSLSGVFYIGGSVAGVGSSLAAKPGYAGSFFTGVLAVIVATPCTAPFMGAALGFALAQPAAALLAVFVSLGLGLATPYLMLSFWPGLQRRLPKPGAWMDRLKQALAFPMYATAVWLLWVLAQQAGPNAVAAALSGMVVMAFAAWLYSSSRNSAIVWRRLSSTLAAAAIAVALIGGARGIETSVSSVPPIAKQNEYWEPYSAARLQALQGQGAPIFLNMTAAWCITCLVNEQVALSDAAVREAFKQAEIVYLKGDWTQRDAEISALLNRFGRSGVPLYVFYPKGADSQPIVLPQILTPEIVLSTVNPS